MTFLDYTEDCTSFQHFWKTDSELAVDDDLVLKCSCIVISSDLYNHDTWESLKQYDYSE